jgi:hypothetical protein
MQWYSMFSLTLLYSFFVVATEGKVVLKVLFNNGTIATTSTGQPACTDVDWTKINNELRD